jgi:hypothetical protein
MLYRSGLPVLALYASWAEVTPAHTVAFVLDKVIVVDVHVPVVTFTIPLTAAKQVLFVFMAEELVLPHDPDATPEPARIKVPEEWVYVPRLARADGLMTNALETVLPASRVTPALLEIVRLPTVAGSPFPHDCALLPL